MFSSKKVTVLAPTFRSVLHFEVYTLCKLAVLLHSFHVDIMQKIISGLYQQSLLKKGVLSLNGLGTSTPISAFSREPLAYMIERFILRN